MKKTYFLNVTKSPTKNEFEEFFDFFSKKKMSLSYKNFKIEKLIKSFENI